MSLFDRITAAVAAQTTVVASVATAFAALAQRVRDEAASLASQGVDTSTLDNLASEIESNTSALSQAAAVNTVASDEVHADDGGTGTDSTVAEPTPAPVEDTTGQAGGADQAAAGAGDAGGTDQSQQ